MRPRSIFLSGALGLALGLLCAGPVQAGTVGRFPQPGFERTPLTFRAAPGEANRLTVTGNGKAGYRVQDRAAPLAAGPGCSPTADPGVAVCTPPGPGQSIGLDAHAGDRDDTLSLFIADATAYGGSGNDALIGGAGADHFEGGGGNDALTGAGGPDLLQGDNGDDVLSGGPGHDSLAAGPGSDQLTGGSGNDALFPNTFLFFALQEPGDFDPGAGAGNERAGSGADRLDGGKGLDVAVYRFENRRAVPRLRVSFDGRANDGPRGERDNAARTLERVYSFAAGKRCRGRICSFGTFGISPKPGPNGERLAPSGAFGLRVYRLSRRGTARASSALFDALGKGSATISEGRSKRSPTRVSLPKGGFGACATRAVASRTRRRRSRRIIHRVRAHARGPRYRSEGRYSAATVRGTDWTVTDRCDGTLTTVRHGVVAVRDFRRHRTIFLRAGQSYLARAP